MSRSIKKYLNLSVTNRLILAICALMVFGCGVLHDDLSNCNYYLRFRYDYNMKSEDWFSKHVERVEVFVFDNNGKFIKSISEEGDALKSSNYIMSLPRSIKDNKIVVWAGKLEDFYTVPKMEEGDPLTKLTLSYAPIGELSSARIDDIWHSGPSVLSFSENGGDTQTVSLLRNTNYINVKLKGENGDIPLTDYKIEMVSKNGSYNHENHFLDDNKHITYTPFELAENNTIAKLVSLRMINGENVQFSIKDKDGNKLKLGKTTDINIIDLLLLNKPANMSEQEYLDREYIWDLIFNIEDDKAGSYLALSITINGWTHWFNDIDL